MSVKHVRATDYDQWVMYVWIRMSTYVHPLVCMHVFVCAWMCVCVYVTSIKNGRITVKDCPCSQCLTKIISHFHCALISIVNLQWNRIVVHAITANKIYKCR